MRARSDRVIRPRLEAAKRIGASIQLTCVDMLCFPMRCSFFTDIDVLILLAILYHPQSSHRRYMALCRENSSARRTRL
jgi:hypothetical protein